MPIKSWVISVAWEDSLLSRDLESLNRNLQIENMFAKSWSLWYMSRLNSIISLCVEIVEFLWRLSGPGPSGWTPSWLFNTIWSQVKQCGGAADLPYQPMGHIGALCNSGKWVEWASLCFHWPLYIILDVAESRYTMQLPLLTLRRVNLISVI